jgi:hypothetical protein
MTMSSDRIKLCLISAFVLDQSKYYGFAVNEDKIEFYSIIHTYLYSILALRSAKRVVRLLPRSIYINRQSSLMSHRNREIGHR